MKITAVVGASPSGNTSEIIRFIKKELKNLNPSIEFETVNLYDYPFSLCIGCHQCILKDERNCPEYLQVKEIEEKMLQSDGVILASPGYMFTVTGIMKNFLDHVAYNCHRPKYFGKKLFLVSACTKWLEKSVFLPMETWGTSAGFILSSKVSAGLLPFPLKDKEIEKMRTDIRKATGKFYRSLIPSGKKIRPDFGAIIIYHVFRTMAAIAPNIMKADYRYYQSIQAYNKKSKWFTEAEIPFFKHIFANYIEKKMRSQIQEIIDTKQLKKSVDRYKNKLINDQ